jgi:dipeptidyl aminopeptidase/acylaminoacyl peptidase
MLVFHGELDRRVDAEQARSLARRLKALGRADEVLLLPREGHGRAMLPPGQEGRAWGFLGRCLAPSK